MRRKKGKLNMHFTAATENVEMLTEMIHTVIKSTRIFVSFNGAPKHVGRTTDATIPAACRTFIDLT